MRGRVRAFGDGERAPVVRTGLGTATLVVQQRTEIVGDERDLRVLGTEQGFLDGERLAVQLFRSRRVAERLLDGRKVVHVYRDLVLPRRPRPAADRKGLLEQRDRLVV